MEKLNPKKIENILALTPPQEGMLFHYLQDPRSQLYFEQLSLEISGEISVDHFKKAWNAVTANNEMLRTVFHWEKLETSTQIILKEHQCNVIFYDLSDKDSHRKKTALEEIKNKDRHEGFDLHRVPFRVILCKLAEKRYEVIISNHHILFDGWSTGIILREFFRAYRESSKGAIFIPAVKPAFKEFVKWMRTQDTVKQEEYWNRYLKGFAPGPDRPVTRKGKKIKNTADYKFKFPGELKTQIDVFIKGHHLTTASFLYSVWGVLLQNYHSRGDIIFDATVSGRSASAGIKGTADMVGLFINTLPMRIQTAAHETAGDFLSRMCRMVQEWTEYENSSPLPVREILDKCRQENLLDSVVVIENYPLDRLTAGETAPLSLHSFSIVERTFYDLTVIITALDGIEFNITYNSDRFDRTVISRLGNHLVSIAAGMVTYPDRAVWEIDIWEGEEKETFLSALCTAREPEPEEVETAYTAPRDEVEKKLVEVWCEILNIDRDAIGIDHNFFDFGGHSLKASLLAAALSREFNVKVPLVEVFRRSTIRELAGYIKRAPGDTSTPLKPVDEEPYYPLSSAQKRMFALQQIDPGSTAYNVTSVMTIEGPLDKNRLEETFRHLLQRHESLRTSFEYIDGDPVQAIHAPDDVPFTIDYYNSATEGTEGTEAGGTRSPKGHGNSPFDIGIISFIRPFDLSGVPLLRVLLVPLEPGKHLLVLDMHHIITDGVSMDIFIKEFSALYKGEELPPLKYQYKDFACRQNDRLQSGTLKPQEEYWLKELSGELPVLNLPTDFPRPSIQSFAGDRLSFYLEESIVRSLRRLAGQTGATLFMMLLAVLNILLSRYAGQEDIIVGTTVAGRDHMDLQNIVGLFIETLALRNSPAGNKSFREFLQEVKTNTLNAFENGAYPFRELMRKVGDAADVSRNPLFNVMLIVQNIDMTPVKIEGLTFTPVDFHRMVSKVDFTLEVFENETGIRFDLEYCTALFRKETMERLTLHFTNILNEVINRPGVLLAEIDMLGGGERNRLLDEFSRGEYENPEGMELKVHRLFEKQAELTPDHIAVVYEEKRATYQELNEKADALSNVIQGL